MAIPSGMGHAGIVAIPIPPDGAAAEVLTKQTAQDYDFDWDPAAGGGPTRADLDSLSYFLGE